MNTSGGKSMENINSIGHGYCGYIRQSLACVQFCQAREKHTLWWTYLKLCIFVWDIRHSDIFDSPKTRECDSIKAQAAFICAIVVGFTDWPGSMRETKYIWLNIADQDASHPLEIDEFALDQTNDKELMPWSNW